MALKHKRVINIQRSHLLALFISGLQVAHAFASANLVTDNTQRLPEFEDVYRIEVIIFTNRNNLDAFSDNNDSDVTEYWNETPALSYPDNLVFLHPPSLLQSQIDALDPQHLEPQHLEPQHLGTQDSKDQLNDSSTETLKPTLETKTPLSEADVLAAPEDSRTAVEKALAALPLLEQLAPDTFLLKDMATAIARRSNHQVLFHQAWHQELGDKKTAPSIPISGGETFDNHRELEGSIKINKDRYLHITSDLWLTQYVLRDDEQWEKLSQEPSENSLLTAKIIDIKAVPDFPLDLAHIAKEKALELAMAQAIKEAELAKIIADEALYQDMLEQDQQANNQPEQPTERVSDINDSLYADEQEQEQEQKQSEKQQDNINSESESSFDTEAALSFDLFQANKTYVLQEHRKMKRAEIHFLDHPMFGLIIQITKYEVPEEPVQAE